MIKFKNIRWKNFLSTGGQFTEIKLDRSPSTLIVGENGAGKSTILDALCFVLFNKPFRNINKPQLMNTINNKALEVEVDFSIGKKDYKIRRGIKPGIFEIYKSGKLLNQDAALKDYQKVLEANIIKMNFRTFTQVVIMGSGNYVPFMKLTTAQRREFIEDVLDIKIFTSMNSILKDKIKLTSEQIGSVESTINALKKEYRLIQGFLKTLETDKKSKLRDVEAKIKEIRKENEKLIKQVESELGKVTKMKPTNTDETTKQFTEVRDQMRDLNSILAGYSKNKLFFEDNDSCPTCAQLISSEFKSTVLFDIEADISTTTSKLDKFKDQFDKLKKQLDEVANIQEQINGMNVEIAELNTKITVNYSLISKYEKEIDEISSNTGNIDDEKSKMKSVAKNIVQADNERQKYLEEQALQDACVLLLKDSGIKTKIIKQYIPIFNKLINRYLSHLDLFVSFELDENFNETVKSRHRDLFTYESFSEGERQRIDLALLFTFRAIARLKNAIKTNLLIMDEILDSSMDSIGIDNFFNLIEELDDTNLFVISHRESVADKFDANIKLAKRNNFTEVVS
jgi:DNA repair exonuclease SbcCD ATPase subunit